MLEEGFRAKRELVVLFHPCIKVLQRNPLDRQIKLSPVQSRQSTRALRNVSSSAVIFVVAAEIM